MLFERGEGAVAAVEVVEDLWMIVAVGRETG